MEVEVRIFSAAVAISLSLAFSARSANKDGYPVAGRILAGLASGLFTGGLVVVLGPIVTAIL